MKNAEQTQLATKDTRLSYEVSIGYVTDHFLKKKLEKRGK